jgi:uncharacterized membrane protein YsdA (DUF1294 family)
MDLPFLPAMVIVYIGLNILAFAVFTYDKLRAKVMMGRSSENSLLFVAVPGPFGALAAMIAFRHKTRHVKFFLVPVLALLHVILILFLWPRLS